jgi:hypothetical protein
MKKCGKRIICLVAIISSTFTFPIDASAQSISEKTLNYTINENLPVSQSDNTYINDVAQLKAAIIGWRYKSVNGQMYRRQYNYSREQWIGEWELC